MQKLGYFCPGKAAQWMGGGVVYTGNKKRYAALSITGESHPGQKKPFLLPCHRLIHDLIRAELSAHRAGAMVGDR